MGLSAAINPVLLNAPPTTPVVPRSSARSATANLYRKAAPDSCRCHRKPAQVASLSPSSSNGFRQLRTRRLRCGAIVGTRMSAVHTSIALKEKAADLSEGLKGTSIYLVGINGTLKTELGKALAEALKYCYFDSDDLVVQASGGPTSVRACLESDEKGFRESETEVLKQLSSMGRLVVCCGDGAVQSATNLACLRHGISVWIDLPLDLLAKEVINGTFDYPYAQAATSTSSFDEVLDGLADHYRENKNGYATADTKISLLSVATQLGYDDFGSVAPEEMALEVLNQIEKLTRIKTMMEEAARPF